jgi:hypothetical protein
LAGLIIEQMADQILWQHRLGRFWEIKTLAASVEKL